MGLTGSLKPLLTEQWRAATAPFRLHLAVDTPACPGGSGHRGPQKTHTSDTHHMPGQQKASPEFDLVRRYISGRRVCF
jgi:hypothetical protein